MKNHSGTFPDPIELSGAAALQLDALGHGARDSAPAFSSFFQYLHMPTKTANGEGTSVLSDFRSYPLLRDSICSENTAPSDTQEFTSDIGTMLQEFEIGILEKDSNAIQEAMRFCLNFNSILLSRQQAAA